MRAAVSRVASLFAFACQSRPPLRSRDSVLDPPPHHPYSTGGTPRWCEPFVQAHPPTPLSWFTARAFPLVRGCGGTPRVGVQLYRSWSSLWCLVHSHGCGCSLEPIYFTCSYIAIKRIQWGWVVPSRLTPLHHSGGDVYSSQWYLPISHNVNGRWQDW